MDSSPGSQAQAGPSGRRSRLTRGRRASDPRQYIQLIEEKNRILKRLNAKREQRREEERKRERGFSVFFAGANQDSNQTVPKPSAARKKSAGATSRRKKTWQRGPQPASIVDQIKKVRPPRRRRRPVPARRTSQAAPVDTTSSTQAAPSSSQAATTLSQQADHTQPVIRNDPTLVELQLRMGQLEEELGQTDLSAAKRYAVKKQLALQKAAKIRALRKAQEQRRGYASSAGRVSPGGAQAGGVVFTVPARGTRKGKRRSWQKSSLTIKTEQGDEVHISPQLPSVSDLQPQAANSPTIRLRPRVNSQQPHHSPSGATPHPLELSVSRADVALLRSSLQEAQRGVTSSQHQLDHQTTTSRSPNNDPHGALGDESNSQVASPSRRGRSPIPRPASTKNSSQRISKPGSPVFAFPTSSSPGSRQRRPQSAVIRRNMSPLTMTPTKRPGTSSGRVDTPTAAAGSITEILRALTASHQASTTEPTDKVPAASSSSSTSSSSTSPFKLRGAVSSSSPPLPVQVASPTVSAGRSVRPLAAPLRASVGVMSAAPGSVGQGKQTGSVLGILQRVLSLDSRRRNYLLKVLDKLEQGDTSAVPAAVWESLQLPQAGVLFSAQSKAYGDSEPSADPVLLTRTTATGSSSPTGATAAVATALSSSAASHANRTDDVAAACSSSTTGVCPARDRAASLVLKIVSNWGHPHSVGLSGVEFFDATGRAITIAPSCVALVSGTSKRPGSAVQHSRSSLAKLVNAPYNTMNGKDMWIQHWPEDQRTKGPLEISFSLANDAGREPGFLHVWNYNRSDEDSSKCVQSLEVWLSGQQRWSGNLLRGFGRGNQAHCTIIPLTEKPLPDAVALDRPQLPESHSLPTLRVDFLPNYGSDTISTDTTKTSGIGRAHQPGLPVPGGVTEDVGHTSSDDSGLAYARPYGVSGSDTREDAGDMDVDTDAAHTDQQSTKLPSWLADASADVLATTRLDVHSPAAAQDVDPSSTPATTNLASAGRRSVPSTRSDRRPSRRQTTSQRLQSGGSGDVTGPAAHHSKTPATTLFPLDDDDDDTDALGAPAGGSDVAQRSMEDSWDSLAFFEKTHLGRLGVSVDLTGMPALAPDPDDDDAVMGGHASAVDEDVEEKEEEVQHASVPVGVSSSANFEYSLRKRRSLPLQQNSARSPTAGPPSASGHQTHAGKSRQLPPRSLSEDSAATINVPAAAPEDELDALLEDSEDFAEPHSSGVVESAAVADEVVPELPRGRKLSLNILSTWGDPHYVGLAGVEMFDEHGELIVLSDVNQQVSANPSSVNDLYTRTSTDLSGPASDPRVATNLLDGINCTNDDMHVWLAPFTQGQNHYVHIEFDDETSLSLIRVWNYNKSRIHTFRGARLVEITLDDTVVFRGELSRAPGRLSDCPDHAEVIRFTNDDAVLDAIARFRPVLPLLDPTVEAEVLKSSQTWTRPMTAESNSDDRTDCLPSFPTTRPRTSARPGWAASYTRDNDHHDVADSTDDDELDALLDDPDLAELDDSVAVQSHGRDPTEEEAEEDDWVWGQLEESECVRGQVVTLTVHSTWGDPQFVGLTGLQLLTADGSPIPLDPNMITAEPEDINSVPGHSGDYRTLDKLVDGTYVTTDDEHMWLAPFVPHLQWLRVDLGRPYTLGGIRVWNYNKSPEDSMRGIKLVNITLDDKLVAPTPHCGATLKEQKIASPRLSDSLPLASVDSPSYASVFCFRRAPGHEDFEFLQTLRFFPCDVTGDEPHDISPVSLSRSWGAQAPRMARRKVRWAEMVVPLLPRMLCVRLVLVSTWGDPHYVGLTGVELVGEDGLPVPVGSFSVSARPPSVAVVPEMAHDVRTLDKLVDGFNDTRDPRHMWLTLYDRSVDAPLPEVVFLFDYPVTLRELRVWNYGKTPARGVHELQVYGDDHLLHHGVVPRAGLASSSGSAADTGDVALSCYVVDFGEQFRHVRQVPASPGLTAAKSPLVGSPGGLRGVVVEQDVVLVNEKRLVSETPQHRKGSGGSASSKGAAANYRFSMPGLSKSYPATRPHTTATAQ